MKKLLFPILAIVGCLQFLNAQTADVSQYIMYFPFDNNLTDASNAGVTLNPKTAATIDTYEAGQFGQAALFNDKPYITANSTFEAGESFSMLMWVKFNSVTGEPMMGTPKIIHQEDDGPTATNLAGRPLQIATAAVVVNTSFGEAARNSLETPELDTWVHIAFVMDKMAGTSTLYIDGIENASGNVGNSITVDNKTNNGQLNIGVQKSSAGHTDATMGLLDAYLDDFVITTEALDVATINNIIANGAAAGGALSVDEFSQSTINLKLYKTDTNTLKVDSNISFDNYQIMDTLGKTMNSGSIENQSITLNSISKGLYFVRLSSQTNGLSITRKIIL